jgi:cytochrome c oxidase subunit II
MTATRVQSALDAAGSYAARIEGLWWVFFWICLVVYALVVVALAAAIFRRRREGDSTGGTAPAIRGVSIATGATVLTMFALLISSVYVGKGLADASPAEVKIKLTAHQWWWQIEYEHPDKSKQFSTANELTIPVGRRVRIELHTADVIHSFWVPNLHGKQDMITGHPGEIILKADRPGTWRGQCAEFCGLQHANMAFWVNAVPMADYAKWLDEQQKPSRIPATIEQRKGQETFLSAPCALCHTIGGTDASGKPGPDLTHFARRRSIAAATAPNGRAQLASWVLDPQHLKPGSNMPPTSLTESELQSLLAYLESLE